MTRKLPIVPTMFVAVAVAAMVGLGFWQIERARWKTGLLARYASAGRLSPLAWPVIQGGTPPLFRHAKGKCAAPKLSRTVAGENLAGESGFAFIADCASGGSVAIGWSKNPAQRIDWAGGPVSGLIVPDPISRVRLVADRAPPGLETIKPPTLDSIPNNHRFYAFQWFFFAAAALVIYGLALRKRWRARP